MAYVRMVIALTVTIFIIIKVNNKKDLIIPVCAVYYFINVLNDIFNVGAPIHLADAFVSYQFGDTLLLIFVGVLILDIFHTPYIKINSWNIFIGYITFSSVFSLIVGCMEFGMSAEWMGDLRSSGLFISGLLYFARFFDIEHIKKYMGFIDKIMSVVLIISFALWGLDLGFGIHILESQYNGTLSDGGSTMRFIQSYEVLALALYALYLVRKDINQKKQIGIKAMIYIISVILFQHRSVWLALGAGLLIILLDACALHKLSGRLFFQGILVIFFSAIVISQGNGGISENIINGFELLQKMISGTSLENTTANTRVDVWEAVIADLTGIAFLFGRPFGYGYGKSIGWATSPHNGYIRMLGRTGWVGLSVMLMMLVGLFIQLFNKNKCYAIEFLVCIIAFMYGYDFTWICGVVIGSCAALLTNER